MFPFRVLPFRVRVECRGTVWAGGDDNALCIHRGTVLVAGVMDFGSEHRLGKAVIVRETHSWDHGLHRRNTWLHL